MSDFELTKDELAALNESFTEHRPSRWNAFWQTHDRDAFMFTCGFVCGVIALVAVFDVWLYLWN